MSLIANLGLLVYFKYANFFLDSLEQALRAAGNTSSLPVLNVLLPTPTYERKHTADYLSDEDPPSRKATIDVTERYPVTCGPQDGKKSTGQVTTI